jgi:UDP-N-acetylmuramoyl-tripeptide--D-alanyl-D-alanine ligase
MLPLSVNELAKILNLNIESSKYVYQAAIDSNAVCPGDLFIAIEGKNNNGHDFLEQVAKKGAVAAIVHINYQGPSFGLDLIRVENIIKAIQEIAKYFISIMKPKIIGITGSIGKTTTKEFTAQLLNESFVIFKTPGNCNGQIGLPLSIINNKQRVELLVLEMGMDQAKGIETLVNIAPPDIAVITEVALVHAASFDNIEEIAKAKAEIFHHGNTSVCILNKDMACFDLIKNYQKNTPVHFSLVDDKAQFFIKKASSDIEVYENRRLTLKCSWPIFGDHNIQNFLAAYCVARSLGVHPDEIKKQIPHLQLPSKRLEIIKKNGITFINDSYNASEKSMIAALQSISCIKNALRKIAILGDMRELGKFSLEMHKNVAYESLKHADTLFCLGQESYVMHEIWQKNHKDSMFFDNKDLMLEKIKSFLKTGDVVLLKGSRVHQLETIIDAFEG